MRASTVLLGVGDSSTSPTCARASDGGGSSSSNGVCSSAAWCFIGMTLGLILEDVRDIRLSTE
jgi:hypothetical protein